MPRRPPPATARGRALPPPKGERLGEVLVQMGALSRRDLAIGLHRAQQGGRRLGDVLLEAGRITRDQLNEGIARQLGISVFDPSTGVDPAAVGLVDERTARRYGAVPVRVDPDGHLVVAMADPSNVFAIDDLRIVTGREIRPALAGPDEIQQLLARTARLDDVVADIIEESDEDGHSDLDALSADISQGGQDDAPVVRLVNSLIARAVDERASDIHFEPQAREMAVRYRVDGVLRPVTSVPLRLASGVVSRVKIMADLDIAEKRVPQDGRVGLAVGGRSLDLRVATLPTVHGEKIVIRVLDKSNVMLKLPDLGFTPDVLGRFEAAYKRPYGAVLVTGPTGSGKSTTLYAALNQLNSSTKNIITVEDPVEYRLPGINQVQVNPRAGLTFAAGLRSILRSDPDIVMIGEVRDRETAQIAVEAALTGHMVLATIHTNDASSTLTRLTEMGVEPFLSASAVAGILAQRLARKLCVHCREQVQVRHAVLREMVPGVALPPGLPDPVIVHRARGCGRCSGSGYHGRVGVFEMLRMNEEIRQLVLAGATADEIARAASRDGMHRLREDGLRKVLLGLTTLEELARTVA